MPNEPNRKRNSDWDWADRPRNARYSPDLIPADDEHDDDDGRTVVTIDLAAIPDC